MLSGLFTASVAGLLSMALSAVGGGVLPADAVCMQRQAAAAGDERSAGLSQGDRTTLPAGGNHDASKYVRQPATPPDGEAGSRFRRNAVGVEFGAAVLGEAWDLNETWDWIADGSVSFWWAFRERAALVLEIHAARVFQESPRNAFLQGFTPIVRFHARRPDPWGLYVEGGPGVSWSDTQVPLRGTRFNYLLLAGTGVSRRLGPQSQVMAGVRWLHISNAGREGRHRNPDIEALGPYVGLTIAF
jgi:hypothetical protein